MAGSGRTETLKSPRVQGTAKRNVKVSMTGLIFKPMAVTLKQTLKATFRRPETILYPHEQKDNSYFRGRNRVIWEKCIGCHLCARICPNSCIEMVEITEDQLEPGELAVMVECRSKQEEKKGYIVRPSLNFGRCLFCGFCAEYCPTGAMLMTPEVELADYSRESLIHSAETMRTREEKPTEVSILNKIQENPVLDTDKCTGCQICMRNCPTQCIVMKPGPKLRKDKPIKNPVFDFTVCVGCATCVEGCKFDALWMEAGEPGKTMAKPKVSKPSPKKEEKEKPAAKETEAEVKGKEAVETPEKKEVEPQ